MRTEDAAELAQTLFEEIRDAVFVVDPQTMGLIDVNPMAERLTTLSRDKLLPLSIHYLFRSNEDESLVYLKRALLTTQTFHSQEGYHLRRGQNDSWIPVNLTLTRLHTEQQPLGLVLARDISERIHAEQQLRLANVELERRVQERTAALAQLNEKLQEEIVEHKLASEALRESEERFRAFMDHNPASAWITDIEGRIVYVSDAYRRTFLLPPGSPVGKSVFDLFPLAIAQVYLDNIRKVAQSNQAIEGIEPAIRVDGSSGEFLIYKFPLPSLGTPLVGGVAIDVTEKNRMQAELQMLDRAITAANQGILVTDQRQPDSPIVYASPGFEKLTGYTKEESIGRNCRFLQGPETDPEATLQLQKAVQKGSACTVEILNYRKNGSSFWNEVSISPIQNADGLITHYVGVQTDVSDRRKLEDQLRQSQKMEAIGRLAAGVAHDFNNLLTVINGYSEILVLQLPPEHPLRELGIEIQKAGERAGSLTRQLLAFGRRDMLAPAILNLNGVVDNTEKMLRRLIGEDVLLNLSLDPLLGSVKADPHQIEQVLINLAVNARDAMPQGGKLTIETRNVFLHDPYTGSFNPSDSGDYVLLSVGDTGMGMDQKTQTRLFEPFFTTKDIGKGTGLGLATVHGIVRQSGGQIAVFSEVGRGTTFNVFFPRIGERAMLSKSQLQSALMPSGTETILLTEDEDSVRNLSRQILRSCGYVVLEASNGREALQLAESFEGTIHLLVSDVVMPHLGGRELAERILSQRPQCKLLFLSGYTDDAVVRHGVFQAEFAFLQKPFSPIQLATKVRELLDQIA